MPKLDTKQAFDAGVTTSIIAILKSTSVPPDQADKLTLELLAAGKEGWARLNRDTEDLK